jgi:hypothetical protein
MRPLIRLITTVVLATVTLVVPAVAAPATTGANATTPTTRANVVAFQLAPPNTAVAPTEGMMAAPGDSIQVTGGGIVTSEGAVAAGGGFVHYNANGAVHCQGWWKATAVTGWTDFGGTQDGRHGGVLSLVVTHYCTTMDEVHTGIPMTVTSTLNAPPGAYTEGTTVADFTRPTGGGVNIWTC